MDTVAYLSLGECAQMLAVSPWTVRRLVLAGTLPGHKFGAQWRVSGDALAAYIRQQAYQPAAQ